MKEMYSFRGWVGVRKMAFTMNGDMYLIFRKGTKTHPILRERKTGIRASQVNGYPHYKE